MNMEYKTLPFEVKDVNMEGIFEGYASTFGNVDLGGDMVQKGAFTKTLQEKKPTEIKILFNHDFDKPIGIYAKIEETENGLYVKGKISKTTLGKDILQLMKDGVLNKLSIGYETIKDKVKDGIRHLTELKLWEISVVTMPMNPLADIVAVKSAETQRQERQLLNKIDSLVESIKALTERIPTPDLIPPAEKSLPPDVEPEKSTPSEEKAEKADEKAVEDNDDRTYLADLEILKNNLRRLAGKN